MSTEEQIQFVRDNCSRAELLVALSEECSELIQAAIKLRRAENPQLNNPTPISVDDAMYNLIEEIADVKLLFDCIGIFDDKDTEAVVEYIYGNKLDRYVNRLKENIGMPRD